MYVEVATQNEFFKEAKRAWTWQTNCTALVSKTVASKYKWKKNVNCLPALDVVLSFSHKQ